MFLENFQLIDGYKSSENIVLSIQKFLGEVNPENYNLLTSITYRDFFKETNNNISLFIEFFHRFSLILKNFQKSDLCKDYSDEVEKYIQFIDSLSINKYHHKVLDFKQRKNILSKIEAEVKNKNFISFWNFYYMFDVYTSIAKGINKYDLTFPRFNSDKTFSIKNFYHLDLKDVVKNTITTTEKNTIIFTGANMSGKSTAMKSISIVVLLAHLGIAVPAENCNIPFYESIFLHFSVNDNLKEGYSHFMQEIVNLKNILQELKTKNCFVVFDEIFNGTNINDAAKITVDTIEGLTKYKNSMFIFSTHLNMIENYLVNNKNIMLLNLESFLIDNELKFTYKLKEGWSKLEIGKILFDKYGLNDLLKHD